MSLEGALPKHVSSASMQDDISHQGGFIERVLSDVHVAQPLLKAETSNDTASSGPSSGAEPLAVEKPHPFEVAVGHLSQALANTGSALYMLDGSLSSVDRKLRIQSRNQAPPLFVPLPCVSDGASDVTTVYLEMRLRSRYKALQEAAVALAHTHAGAVASIARGRRRHAAVSAAINVIATSFCQHASDAGDAAALSCLYVPSVSRPSSGSMERAVEARAAALGLWLLRADARLQAALRAASVSYFSLPAFAGSENGEERPRKKHRQGEHGAGARDAASSGSGDTSSSATGASKEDDSMQEWEQLLQWPPEASFGVGLGGSRGDGSATASPEGLVAPSKVGANTVVVCAGFLQDLPASRSGKHPYLVHPAASTVFVLPDTDATGKGPDSGAAAEAGAGAASSAAGAATSSSSSSSSSSSASAVAAADSAQVVGFGPLGSLGCSHAPLVFSATVLVRDDAAASNGWLTEGGPGVPSPAALQEAMRVRRPAGWRVAARAEWRAGIGETGAPDATAASVSAQAGNLMCSLSALWGWVRVLANVSTLEAAQNQDSSGGIKYGQAAMDSGDGSEDGASLRAAAGLVRVSGSAPLGVEHALDVLGNAASAPDETGRGTALERALLVDALSGCLDDVAVTRLRAAAAAASKVGKGTSSTPDDLGIRAIAAVRRLCEWRFLTIPAVTDESVTVVVGVEPSLGKASTSSATPAVLHSVGGAASSLAEAALEACTQAAGGAAPVGGGRRVSLNPASLFSGVRTAAIRGMLAAAQRAAGRPDIPPGSIADCKPGSSISLPGKEGEQAARVEIAGATGSSGGGGDGGAAGTSTGAIRMGSACVLQSGPARPCTQRHGASRGGAPTPRMEYQELVARLK